MQWCKHSYYKMIDDYLCQFSRNASSPSTVLKDRRFTNGTSRFLFDQIFGLGGDDDDDDDDDENDGAKVKNCTCGKKAITAHF